MSYTKCSSSNLIFLLCIYIPFINLCVMYENDSWNRNMSKVSLINYLIPRKWLFYLFDKREKVSYWKYYCYYYYWV